MGDVYFYMNQTTVPFRPFLKVDSTLLERFAVIARDPNPIHLDAEAAKKRGLPGRIAHGMLIAAALERVAREEGAIGGGGSAWLLTQTEFRFREMTLLGESLECGGEWKSTDPHRKELHLIARPIAESTGSRAVRATAIFTFESLKAE